MVYFATQREKELYREVQLLKKQIHDLKQLVAMQNEKIAALEKRLNKDSSNSSKPPSTDGFIRIVKTRTKSKKKSGGQIGHKGETLLQVSNPDKIIRIPITTCQHCNCDISSQASTIEKRQVFDIPKPKTEVIEYRSDLQFNTETE